MNPSPESTYRLAEVAAHSPCAGCCTDEGCPCTKKCDEGRYCSRHFEEAKREGGLFRPGARELTGSAEPKDAAITAMEALGELVAELHVLRQRVSDYHHALRDFRLYTGNDERERARLLQRALDLAAGA